MSELHHVCYEVDDLERAAEALARLHGAGPFFAREPRPFDELDYGPGGECVMEHAIAFGLVRGRLVELKVLLRAEPPALAAALSQAPVNHLAYVADDFEAGCDRLEAGGGRRIVTARTGPFQFAYHRVPVLGLVETLRPCQALVDMEAAIAAETERWDGTAPLRSDEPSIA
jgi:catechol 2,3-dioxygenase-like lactoylglutathione lyase family enzyme